MFLFYEGLALVMMAECVVHMCGCVGVSVAATAILADEINDGLSLLMVLLFVVGFVCVC
jgi:hypothetical protein